MNNKYKFKFYINASHSIYIDGVMGEEHPHTWEITLDTVKGMGAFIQFHQVEKAMEDFLERFQGVYLNGIEPFQTINPTLENICEYLNEEIKSLLYQMGWVLTTIEISETPTRSYIIDSIDEADELIDEIERREINEEIERIENEILKNLLVKKTRNK